MMELTEKIAKSTGLAPDIAEKLLKAFVKTLTEQTNEGNAVAIPGFGTFQPEKTEEYVKTDTSTGKRYLVPPEIKAVFKTSVVLRKKLLG